MKIRIKGNSIRFRLTQSEVKQLSETGSVKESTEFGPNVFQYQVKLMSSVQNLEASYSNDTILMMIPEADGNNWFHNDTIGFEHEMELPKGRNLHLLLKIEPKTNRTIIPIQNCNTDHHGQRNETERFPDRGHQIYRA